MMTTGWHTPGTSGGKRERRRLFTMAAAYLLVLLTAACDADTDPFQIRLSDLDDYAATWAAQRSARYMYRVTRQCECVPGSAGPAIVTVEGDSVIGRYYELSGEPVPMEFEEFFPSVEGLFDIIRDALENRYSVTVTYDEQTGVPLTVWVDPHPDHVDDEYGYTANFPVALPSQGG